MKKKMRESEFAKQFMGILKREHVDCTRIESGTTVVGIPDLFIQGGGDDLFIELKVCNNSIHDNFIKVPWRPGQQAWLRTYYIAHNLHKSALTVVRCNDGLLFIKHTCVYENNIVASELHKNHYTYLPEDVIGNYYLYNFMLNFVYATVN